jgi:hypothetical protein
VTSQQIHKQKNRKKATKLLFTKLKQQQQQGENNMGLEKMQ